MPPHKAANLTIYTPNETEIVIPKYIYLHQAHQ